MSVEKAIGAEYNTLAELDGSADVTLETNATYRRTGSYCFKMTSYVTCFMGINVTGRDEYYIQWALYIPQPVASTAKLLEWRSGAVILGCLEVEVTTGIIKAYRGDKAALVGTGITPLAVGAMNIIQTHIKIADSDGKIRVKIGAILDIDFTGDTKPGSETNIDSFRTLSDWCGTSGAFVDDVVIFNTLGTRCNSWPNGIPVYVMRPNANGNYSQWSRSAGSNNYECVDELPPTSADYVYTNATAQKDSYNFPDAVAALASGVTAIIADYFGQAVGAPATTQIKRLIRISSVDYEGSGITLQNTFSKHTDVVELNPADNQPWEKSDLDALELGMTSLT